MEPLHAEIPETPLFLMGWADRLGNNVYECHYDELATHLILNEEIKGSCCCNHVLVYIELKF